jgi:integrase
MASGTSPTSSDSNGRDVYPKQIKSGAAVVTIYRRTAKLTDKSKESKADLAEGKAVGSSYEQFTIYYQLNGEEYRFYRNSKKDAFALARKKALEIERGEVQSLTLTGSEMEAYLRAREVLAAEDISLESAIRDYIAAYRLVRPLSLVQIARQHQEQGARPVVSKTIEEVVPEFLAARAQEGSERHLETLTNDLVRFHKRFKGRLLDVNSSEIEDWLQSLLITDRYGNVKPGAKLVSSRTKRNIYGSLANLFHWAQRKNYLPRERPTEVDYMEKPGKSAHVPQSFSAGQIGKLLEAAPDRLIPLIALCAFAGIRRAEIERLDWEDVRFEHLDIQIWADNAKTHVRRLPPLLPNSQAWLESWKGSVGRVCPHADRFNQITELAKNLGLTWAHDILRDSFISNRTAILKDIPKVANEAGNSQRVIQESYLKRVTEKEGTAFFNVYPKRTISKAIQDEL